MKKFYWVYWFTVAMFITVKHTIFIFSLKAKDFDPFFIGLLILFYAIIIFGSIIFIKQILKQK